MLSYRNEVIFFLSLCLFSQSLQAQNVSGEDEEFFYDRPSLLILLSTGLPQGHCPLEQEILDTVTRAVSELGSFDIIDPYTLRDLSGENVILDSKIQDDSKLLSLSRLVYAHEMMLIDILTCSMDSLDFVDTEKEKVSDTTRKNTNNISNRLESGRAEAANLNQKYFHTRLSIQLHIFQVKDGEPLETINIDVTHSDTTEIQSVSAALKELGLRATSELQEIYFLSSKIIAQKSNEVQINQGYRTGLHPGMMFIVRTPDQWEEYYDEIVIIPGKDIGLIEAHHIAEQQSKAKILRQTAPFHTGYRAFEYPQSIYGLRIYFSPEIADSIMSLGVQLFWRAVHSWYYGLGFRLIRSTDSRNGKNFGFGMEGLGAIQFYRIPRIKMSGIFALNFDLPFRNDDNNNTVFLPIFSGEIGIKLDFNYFWKSDISISTGYRIASSGNNWQISSEEEDVQSVYWEGSPPTTNISGVFIQVGYTFLLFRR